MRGKSLGFAAVLLASALLLGVGAMPKLSSLKSANVQNGSLVIHWGCRPGGFGQPTAEAVRPPADGETTTVEEVVVPGCGPHPIQLTCTVGLDAAQARTVLAALKSPHRRRSDLPYGTGVVDIHLGDDSERPPDLVASLSGLDERNGPITLIADGYIAYVRADDLAPIAAIAERGRCWRRADS